VVRINQGTYRSFGPVGNQHVEDATIGAIEVRCNCLLEKKEGQISKCEKVQVETTAKNPSQMYLSDPKMRAETDY